MNRTLPFFPRYSAFSRFAAQTMMIKEVALAATPPPLLSNKSCQGAKKLHPAQGAQWITSSFHNNQPVAAKKKKKHTSPFSPVPAERHQTNPFTRQIKTSFSRQGMKHEVLPGLCCQDRSSHDQGMLKYSALAAEWSEASLTTIIYLSQAVRISLAHQSHSATLGCRFDWS